MFAIVEKQGERKAVYSEGDLVYLKARGWNPVTPEAPRESAITLPKKRGRPPKAKE